MREQVFDDRCHGRVGREAESFNSQLCFAPNECGNLYEAGGPSGSRALDWFGAFSGYLRVHLTADTAVVRRPLLLNPEP